MNRCLGRVAQSALGIGFEQWKQRPVFKVQCLTYKAAAELCGLKSIGCLPQGLTGPYAQALQGFRMLKPYRCSEANALRLRVARHIKAQRRDSALMV